MCTFWCFAKLASEVALTVTAFEYVHETLCVMWDGVVVCRWGSVRHYLNLTHTIFLSAVNWRRCLMDFLLLQTLDRCARWNESQLAALEMALSKGEPMYMTAKANNWALTTIKKAATRFATGVARTKTPSLSRWTPQASQIADTLLVVAQGDCRVFFFFSVDGEAPHVTHSAQASEQCSSCASRKLLVLCSAY